ncbi:RNA polymerase sigma factor [Fulvivirga sp. RKSG066]|uniref:RNA polymerase sigma factor n=1 Tax=Fulvivirga aurantia TaxID=2529383 RepID=UPI0012BC0329|nr:RNA polymerase sigma factor [Fulvivirga aurantia]MTI21036.1 RNA polymerase sigma factor [Fulvivirga aurantia]
MISDKELYKLLDACKKGSRNGQNELYKEFYAYSMSICLRYSKTRQEAIEILNDGFLKIFTKIEKYTKGRPFKGWLRRVMINAAIDCFRRNEKHYHGVDISYAKNQTIDETAISKFAEEDILKAIQALPPSYRMVFNLHAIEGYKHEEIAQKLNITVGTSKSNLAVARSKLKRTLAIMGGEKEENHGRQKV